MRASVHRRVALVFLIPLGIAPEAIRAGLVEHSIQGLGLGNLPAISRFNSPTDDFDLLALRAPGKILLAFTYASDNASNAGPAQLDEAIVADLLTIVPNERLDLAESINPFAHPGLGFTISDLLREGRPATESALTAERDQVLVYALGTDSITTLGSPWHALADFGTTSFTVPEPTVLLLLAAGIPAIIGRRSRHRP